MAGIVPGIPSVFGTPEHQWQWCPKEPVSLRTPTVSKSPAPEKALPLFFPHTQLQLPGYCMLSRVPVGYLA